MIDINLLPWRQEKREMQHQRWALAISIAALSACVVLATMYYFAQLSVRAVQKDNQYIQAAMREFSHGSESFGMLKEKNQQLLAEQAMLNKLHTNRFQLVGVLNGLLEVVPEGVMLTEILRRGDRLMLSGIANNNTDITALLRATEASTWFINSAVQEITDRDGTMAEAEGRAFRLTMVQKEVANISG